MSTETGPQSCMPKTCAILLVLAFVSWIIVISCASSMHESDRAGNAMTQGFMFLFAIAQWIMLAIVILTALFKVDMPFWAKTSACILVPIACAASFGTLNMLASEEHAGGWLLTVPILTPPLVAFYAIWAFVPRLHSAVPLNIAGVVVWSVVAILSVLPIPSILLHEIASGESRDEIAGAAARERQERTAGEREEWPARFRMLPPDAALWEWRPFTEHGEELRQMALDGIRRLANRQSDAEMLLDMGLNFPMLHMPQMDLEATPALCESARRFLRKRVGMISPAVPGRPYNWEKDSVDPYLSTMEWLLQHGCDCGPEVAQIEAAVLAYPKAADREQTLAVLARIRKATDKP